MTTIITEATVEQQRLLVDAVRAKAAYWKAMDALEHATTDGDGWLDEADAYIGQRVINMALAWDENDPHGGFATVEFKTAVEELLILQNEEN